MNVRKLTQRQKSNLKKYNYNKLKLNKHNNNNNNNNNNIARERQYKRSTVEKARNL